MSWLPPRTVLGIPKRRFLIFAPWCDQGLGVQAKTYVYWLQKLQYTVYIYACVPAKQSSETAPEHMQADPSEWDTDNIIYDLEYTRETVPVHVVQAAVQRLQITDVWLLEVCQANMLALATVLQRTTRVWAIPNVEMVRRCELPRFRQTLCHAILCNNQDTLNTLTFFGLPKLHVLPFALPSLQAPQAALHVPGTPVRFLLVGGMNVERRKQASKVLKAFTQAFRHTDDAHLTILAQGVDWQRAPRTPHNVTAILQHLTYQQILEQYAQHHVVIACSRAEGLGLMFYEAFRARCAVLTLNTPMYKERVTDKVTGWIVRTEQETGTVGATELGNDDPIVRTHTFQITDLQALLTTIAQSNQVAACQENARRVHEASEENLLEKYRQVLEIG